MIFDKKKKFIIAHKAVDEEGHTLLAFPNGNRTLLCLRINKDTLYMLAKKKTKTKTKTRSMASAAENESGFYRGLSLANYVYCSW